MLLLFGFVCLFVFPHKPVLKLKTYSSAWPTKYIVSACSVKVLLLFPKMGQSHAVWIDITKHMLRPFSLPIVLAVIFTGCTKLI